MVVSCVTVIAVLDELRRIPRQNRVAFFRSEISSSPDLIPFSPTPSVRTSKSFEVCSGSHGEGARRLHPGVISGRDDVRLPRRLATV